MDIFIHPELESRTDLLDCQSMTTPAAISPQDANQLAIDRFLQGDISIAERICQAVLSASPDYYPSVEFLALINERQGRVAEALAGAKLQFAHLTPVEQASASR